MTTETHPEYAPDAIIVPAADLVDNFHGNTHGKVWPQDFKEIMIEVVQVLLNEENGNLTALEGLPQINRMVNGDFLIDHEYYTLVQRATQTLGVDLYNRLKHMGAYVDETFSFFFDQFLGDDLVLVRLPH